MANTPPRDSGSGTFSTSGPGRGIGHSRSKSSGSGIGFDPNRRNLNPGSTAATAPRSPGRVEKWGGGTKVHAKVATTVETIAKQQSNMSKPLNIHGISGEHDYPSESVRDAIFFCRLTKDTGVLRPAQKYNIEPENAQDLPSWLTELERRQGFRYTLQVRLPARFSFMVPTPSNAQPFDLFIKLSPHRRGPFPVELPKDPDVWQPRFDPKKPVELVCHIPEWLTSALHVGGPVASGARFIPKVRPLANDPGFLRKGMFLGVNLVVPGVDILKAKYLILRMRHDQSSHWMNRLVEEIRSDAASLKVKHICADPIVLFAILEQRQLTSPVKQAVPKMIAGQKVAGQYDEPIVSYEKALKKARDWTIEFAVPEPTEAMRQELKRIVQWNGFCVWKCEPLFSNA